LAVGAVAAFYERMLASAGNGTEEFENLGARYFDAVAYDYNERHSSDALHVFAQSGTHYLFDLASSVAASQEDRTVAAWTVTKKPPRPKASPRNPRALPPSTGISLSLMDVGRINPFGPGEERDFGPDLFPIERHINRGWSPDGKRYRALRREMQLSPSAFIFSQLHYTDLSMLPAAIETGFVFSGRLRVERFYNRPQDFGREATNLVILTGASGRLQALPVAALPVGEILGVPSSLHSASWLIYLKSIRRRWQDELAEFEGLLNDPRTPERVFQAFFERNPHLLGGIDYESVIPHPILQRSKRGHLIPDFMLVPDSHGFADILDLKKPSAPLIVGSENRLRYSANVEDAIAQLREYRAYFDDQEHREAFLGAYGIRAYRPNVSVIIGRDPSLSDSLQVRRLEDELPRHLRITTYDQLLRRMRLLSERYS
jgi:hypothetical protein